MSNLIGIATWNFGEGSLAERIERFAGMGYNAVSLIARDAGALCRGETGDVEDAIARHSLPVTIHGGLAPKGVPIDAGAVLADFERYAAWHAKTGALVSVNYDAAKVQAEDGTWEFQSEAMRDVLDSMLRVSEGAGFTVGIEDWPRDAEQLRVVEGLRRYAHYGVLIDLGHMNMRVRGAEDPDYPFPVEAVKGYLDRIELPVNELHVHNNNGRRDMHAPPTSGTADMAVVASLLAAKGVDCISTIELVPAWCGLSDEEGFEAARDALAFWREALVK